MESSPRCLKKPYKLYDLKHIIATVIMRSLLLSDIATAGRLPETEGEESGLNVLLGWGWKAIAR